MTRADLVVTGRIATLAGDADDGFAFAEAIAIARGRVVAAGSRADIEGLVGPGTRRLALGPDELAIPGLTDAHLHLATAAVGRDQVDLSVTATLEAGLEVIAAAVARLPPGVWIEGHGWAADRWGRWPSAADLETVAPGRLVALWAHDHHALWASVAALRRAGVGAGTPDPPGGIIRRRADGTPEGCLLEAAARLVTSIVPQPDAPHVERAVAAYQRRLLDLGVVAVHDPGALAPDHGWPPALAAYARLADRGDLILRVHASLRPESLEIVAGAGLASGDVIGEDPGSRARLGWLKLFADGTLGSRTAAMLEPYDDAPQVGGPALGVFTTPPAELGHLAAAAAGARIATQIHAIGDAGVRAALDALGPTVGQTALVPRVEHVQLLAPADRPRFAGEGIAASVQPVHLRSDATAARRRWGPRAETSGYAWRSLAATGTILAFGTDAPVEPEDPWPGIELAVTRRSPAWPAEEGEFGLGEALTLARALRAACVDPALSAGETDRGRLVPAHRADLAVVAAAAFDEPVAPGGALGRLRPRLVLVDGEIVSG